MIFPGRVREIADLVDRAGSVAICNRFCSKKSAKNPPGWEGLFDTPLTAEIVRGRERGVALATGRSNGSSAVGSPLAIPAAPHRNLRGARVVAGQNRIGGEMRPKNGEVRKFIVDKRMESR